MCANASSSTRRSFLSTSAACAVTVAASQLAAIGSADAQPGKTKRADLPMIKPGTNTSFVSLKQIEAGVMSVGYAEAGPANGPVVFLLHGWPNDIHTYIDVAPLLGSAGYRVHSTRTTKPFKSWSAHWSYPAGPIRTTTDTGLTVRAELDRKKYPKGVKVSNAQLAAVNLIRHTFHGDWNYTIKPNSRRTK